MEKNAARLIAQWWQTLCGAEDHGRAAAPSGLRHMKTRQFTIGDFVQEPTATPKMKLRQEKYQNKLAFTETGTHRLNGQNHKIHQSRLHTLCEDVQVAVSVTAINGETVVQGNDLLLSPDDRVQTVKATVFERSGILSHSQALFGMNGKEMLGSSTLAEAQWDDKACGDCFSQPSSHLHLLLVVKSKPNLVSDLANVSGMTEPIKMVVMTGRHSGRMGTAHHWESTSYSHALPGEVNWWLRTRSAQIPHASFLMKCDDGKSPTWLMIRKQHASLSADA
jgi:hypothetical protein